MVIVKQVATHNTTPHGTTETVRPKVVDEGRPVQAYTTKKAIFRTYQVLWYLLGLVEVLLVFRFILKFLGANPTSGFVQMIYQLTTPFVMPFWGIFGNSQALGSVIEWSTIFAMVVYAIVVWGVVKLLQIVKPVTPEEVDTTVDSQ